MPSRSFARSLIVGAAATLADLAALELLVGALGVAPVWANVPALTLGLAVQFFGNKLFAFSGSAGGARAYLKQGGQFALVEAGALALNALAYHLLVTLTPLSYLAARVAGSAIVYVVYSYPLWARIFAPAPTPAPR